jgi:hypothetical protein
VDLVQLSPAASRRGAPGVHADRQRESHAGHASWSVVPARAVSRLEHFNGVRLQLAADGCDPIVTAERLKRHGTVPVADIPQIATVIIPPSRELDGLATPLYGTDAGHRTLRRCHLKLGPGASQPFETRRRT